MTKKADEVSIAELCAPLSAKVESTRPSWAHEVLGSREGDRDDLSKRRRASTYWKHWHAARRAQKIK